MLLSAVRRTARAIGRLRRADDRRVRRRPRSSGRRTSGPASCTARTPRSPRSPTGPTCDSARTPREAIDAIQADLRAFKRAHKLDQVVVVNVASTEPPFELGEEHQSLDRLLPALDRPTPAALPDEQPLRLRRDRRRVPLRQHDAEPRRDAPGARGTGPQARRAARRPGRQDRRDAAEDACSPRCSPGATCAS